MITYRLAEFGVERIENGASTFIHNDPRHPAWREFQAWRSLGHQPTSSLPRPVFPEPPLLDNLYIIGAGGYGREVLWMTRQARGFESEWHVTGFLNDIADSLNNFPGLPPIKGDTEYQPINRDCFICAIGDQTGRKSVADKFKQRGAKFINLLHNSANVSPSARFGEGIIVEPLAGIGADCVIGDFTAILAHAIIAHDVHIGPVAQISPFASILGRAVIGEQASIGSHAVILPDVKIGARAKVGAGSVVIKDVPEGSTVFGVPARQIN